MRIDIFAIRFLVPFAHSHGTWINACVLGASVNLSGSIFASPNTGRCCVGRMPEPRNNGLHDADRILSQSVHSAITNRF